MWFELIRGTIQGIARETNKTVERNQDVQNQEGDTKLEQTDYKAGLLFTQP
jgi:hypothetical protein